MRGVIYNLAVENLKYTNFHFLIADGPTYFDTSDNPSFIFTRNDSLKEGLMPITPKILLAQGKKTDKEEGYCVTHITDEAVKRYNCVIRSNASEFIIHPHE